jgi:hypothetical protein
LSLDVESDNLLKNFKHKNLTVINFSKFTTENISILKNNRSIVEFCWTCKSYLINYIFTNYINVEWAIYIDSDSCIFGNLDMVIPNEISYSVILTPHRSNQNYFNSQIEKSGIYNAGFIGFRNNPNGKSVLNWWLNNCTISCSSIVTNDIYGDQLYLNQIPQLFNCVFIHHHLGINSAPWNITDKFISTRNYLYYVNDDQLLHYHFQGFEFIKFYLFDIYKGNYKINSNIKFTIYSYYIKLFRNVLFKNFDKNFNINIYDTRLTFKFVYYKILKFIKGSNNIIIYYE